jgi:hypothetical protein
MAGPNEMLAKEQLLAHVSAMVRYWNGEGGSNVPPKTGCRDRLEGLAFSLLVMLDGGSVDVEYGWLLEPVDEHGNVGESIAGTLHEEWKP